MAITVIQAFDKFLSDTVNLEADKTRKARGSREWLVGQIQSFPVDDDKFPNIYDDRNIFYGSFSRGTKKRPLDDIDIMICLKADGCTYTEYIDKIQISVPTTAIRFVDYLNDDTNILNSRKLINAFVSKLAKIPQYRKAEIKRNHEAATLNLETYDWVFDIVPCFFTTEDFLKRTYYLIPDGMGNWKKTDPRLDSARVITLDAAHGNNLRNVIRTIKYWNNRPTMPKMESYLLENMILDYYSEKTSVASKFVDIEVVDVLLAIHKRVYGSVNDPKEIQGDLNKLTFQDRNKISDRAYDDYVKAFDARRLENEKKQKESINKWREIFGDEFPKYEI